jgi:uncharacterized OsmC-like protein
MLVNHRSGSDSEVTPMAFRQLGLGRIVGNPTAAAVIATGSYALINGGSIRTPGSLVVTWDPTKPNNYGVNLENYGVPPDVWVENTPMDEVKKFDRELKVAIDEALKMLRANPPRVSSPSSTEDTLMNSPEEIRTALERMVKAVTLRPAVAKGKGVTRVKWREGLTCDVQQGPWNFVVSMPENHGGENLGPNPGFYGRTALGSCLALGYAMWASRLGIPLRGLEVEVQADYDSRGELGVDDSVRPGYTGIRLVVTVDSDAPEAEVIRLLETAERYSSWLDDLRNPVPVEREVRFASPAGG